MKTASRVVLAIVVGVFSGCGDNWEQRECGPGTHDQDGVCLPDGETNCGPGTVEMNGECVPDGSVVCGDGTVFDPGTGMCDPDPTVCAPGTVLVNGMCQDTGVVTVDAEEADEPNDGNGAGEIAGQITVPSIGSAGFVIHGCVNPYQDADGNGNLDADYDLWIIQVTQPTALHITADGVQGLAAGFIMLAGDQQLVDDGWQRIGANLVDDKSERELYLPKAGVYGLAMTDSRSIFIDAAGNPDACYYTTIEQIALPAATPGTIANTTGTDDGSLRVVSFDPAEGDLFDNLFDDGGSTALAGGIVILRNGNYAISAVESSSIFGPTPAETFQGGLANADTFEVVIDPLYDIAISPQDYTLVTTQFTAQALPTAGSTISVTPNPPYFSFFYFDVAADGEIDHFDMSFSDPLQALRITDANLNTIADIGPPPVVDFQGQFVRFPTAGRYYVLGFAPDPWTLTNTLTAQVATPFTVGTPVTGAGLPATGSAFYTFTVGSNVWNSITAAAQNGGAQIFASPYLLGGFGWLNDTRVAPQPGRYNSVGTFTFDAAGGDVFEHIFLNDPNDYLVRVEVTAPAPATTYDVDIETVPYVDLGTAVAGTPIDHPDESFAAGNFARYIVQGGAGGQVTITASPNTATPNVDVILAAFDPNVQVIGFADSFGPGGPETVVTGINPLGWAAFGVGDFDGNAGTVDVHLVADFPQPFVEICPDSGGTGTDVTLNDDGSGFGGADEGLSDLQTLGTPFPMFGTDVTDYVISSNGWVSFDPASVLPGTGNGTNGAEFINRPLPFATDANGMMAPFWSDAIVEVCTQTDATRTIIEWQGNLYPGGGTPVVHHELSIFNTGGRVEFAYAPDHTATGAPNGTGGVENIAGDTAFQLFFNAAAVAGGTGAVIIVP